MPNTLLVLCDERDVEVARAMADGLEKRGRKVQLQMCDAAEESLGAAARESLATAAGIVVIVREGGRGNRLLHAAEDETPQGAHIVSLMADGVADDVVSTRTQARIDALAETLAAGKNGRTPLWGTPKKWGTPKGAAPTGSGPKPPPGQRRRRLIAALMALVVAIGVVLWLLRSPNAPFGGPPVLLTGMLSNSGWTVQFHLREEAASLEYRLPSNPDFISTGEAGLGSGPNRDERRAKLFATVPDLHGSVPFQVRYQTPDGANRGPYEVVFDTTAQSVAWVKRVLSDVPAWVAFRDFQGRHLCYFSTLLSYKFGLRSIRYGIDTPNPDRNVRFIPSDVPGIHNDDELFIDLPEDASSVTVELLFLDGTISEKKRFQVNYGN